MPDEQNLPDAPEHAADEPESTASAPPARPPQKSRYAMSAKDMSMRNITWALGLTMGLVVVVAVLFFGVGWEDEREVPENSQLDIAESAERAQQTASFPVAVPELGDEWTLRSARFSGADEPSWDVRYTSPTGSLVAIVQQAEVTPAMLNAAVPGAAQQGTVEVDGVECEELVGDTEDAARALSCSGDGWGLLVHGSSEPGELEEVAGAAIADIDDQ